MANISAEHGKQKQNQKKSVTIVDVQQSGNFRAKIKRKMIVRIQLVQHTSPLPFARASGNMQVFQYELKN